MEIEAKFTVDDEATYRRLLDLRELAGFTIEHGPTITDRDQYLDTADGRFLAAGYFCRLRGEEDYFLVTLKSIGETGGAVHRRDEREVRLENPETDPARWPDGPARWLAVDLPAGAALEPLLQLRQTRARRTVRAGGREVGEMTVDRVEPAAGDHPATRGESYYELEIELKGDGKEDDLKRLTEVLAGEWGLAAQTRSKFQRALAALRRRGRNSAESQPTTGGAGQAIQDAFGRGPGAAVSAAPGGQTAREAGWTGASTGEPARQVDYLQGPPVPGTGGAQIEQSAAEPGATSAGADEASAAPAGTAAAHPGEPARQVDYRQGPPAPETGEAQIEQGAAEPDATSGGADEASAAEAQPGEPDRQVDQLQAQPAPETGGAQIEQRPSEPDAASGGADEADTAAAHQSRHDDRENLAAPESGARAGQSACEPAEAEGQAAQAEAATWAAYEAAQRPVDARHGVAARESGAQEGPDAQGVARAELHAPEPSAPGPVADEAAQIEEGDGQGQAAPGDDGAQPGQRGATSTLAEAAQGDKEQSEPEEQPLRADDAMSEAGRRIMLIHYRKMVENEEGTRSGEDDEALHDMRVATRRMRAAYDIFCPYYDAKSIGKFIKGLKKTGRELGTVRDLDVLIKKARVYQEEHGAAQDVSLDPLLDAWTARRNEARDELLGYLNSGRYDKFKGSFGEFLETECAGALPIEPGEPTPYRVCDVVPRLVMERYEAVRAYEPVLKNAPMATYHQLRIACKKLRYTLEFFKDVLGDPAPKLIKRVTEMQDLLGDQHDSAVSEGLVADFLAEQVGQRLTNPRPPSLDGAAAYLAAQWAIQRDIMERFPDMWATLTGYEFRKSLSLAVAAL